MIAAWTRSKSLFSSPNSSACRVPHYCFFNSASFCSRKPSRIIFSSSNSLSEALLDAILLTGRHGSKQQTSDVKTPSSFRVSEQRSRNDGPRSSTRRETILQAKAVLKPLISPTLPKPAHFANPRRDLRPPPLYPSPLQPPFVMRSKVN